MIDHVAHLSVDAGLVVVADPLVGRVRVRHLALAAPAARPVAALQVLADLEAVGDKTALARPLARLAVARARHAERTRMQLILLAFTTSFLF